MKYTDDFYVLRETFHTLSTYKIMFGFMDNHEQIDEVTEKLLEKYPNIINELVSKIGEIQNDLGY